MIDDATLLRRYAAERAEDAFAELVRRYLPLVYSAALRRLGGDAHRAQDVAQVVFCALARDAHRIARHPVLSGWFYTATRNAVIDTVRTEKRRRLREQEAHLMHETAHASPAPNDWSQLRPVIDSAMDQLSARDREAVLLRFFQGQPFAEIGALVGVSEDAARKRVDRALDKLRDLLRPHGIASTSTALATLLSAQAISAAPAALAANITGAALATVAGGAAAAAGGIVTLFAMTKLQAGIAAAVIVGGTAGLLTQQHTISTLRDDHAATQQHLARLTSENAALAQAQATANAELATARSATAVASAQTSTSSASSAPPGGSTRERSQPAPPSTSAAPEDSALHEQKARLHRRYDPFLQKYGLTPEQADRFVALKLAIFDAQADLQAAMREAGASGGTAGVEAMRSQLVKPMWDEIRQLLGPDGYAAYGEYERSSVYRLGYVEPLLPAFASANATLTPQQADDLVRVFAASNRSIRAKPTDLGTTGVMDWDAVVADAAPILTPTQLALLRDHATRRKSAHRSP